MAISEKWLCHLWRRQRWTASPLVTSAGLPVHVIYPGRHTFDHGPDFRDALLVFEDELVRGDVEVHVRRGDWHSHGHQADTHYDRVVLHVVWEEEGAPALTSAGQTVPALALARLVDDIPLIADEAGPEGENEESAVGYSLPCATQRGESRARLARLGEQRLAGKAAAFEAALAVEAPAQVLYAGLLDALGYSSNREACRELSRTLPWTVVAAAAIDRPPASRIADMEALFLGASGLLPAQGGVKRALSADDSAYAGDLAARWSALNALWRLTPLPREAWRFARVRPENFPPRRLAAAARLLAPYTEADLAGAFLGVLRSEEPDEAPAALEAALAVPAVGYWATHHDFGGRPSAPTLLLGRGRAADAAVNVILPFAIAWGETFDDELLRKRASAIFQRYPPLSENEITRYVARLAFGRARRLGLTASHQQGLLHIYRGFCKEKRCGECPLGLDDEFETEGRITP